MLQQIKCSTISFYKCYNGICEGSLFKTFLPGWIFKSHSLQKQWFATSYRLWILDNTKQFFHTLIYSELKGGKPHWRLLKLNRHRKKKKKALIVGSHWHKHKEILSYRYFTLSFFHWHCNFCQHSKKIQPWSKVAVWQSWKWTSSVYLN